MKKNDIYEIIKQGELKTWKELKRNEIVFGNEHKWTIRKLAEWAVYYDLIEKLKITQLPR